MVFYVQNLFKLNSDQVGSYHKIQISLWIDWKMTQ